MFNYLGKGNPQTTTISYNEVLELLEKAIRYLEDAKRKLAPNTTNSEVDDFLKQRRLEIIKEECYYCGEDIEPNEENKLTDSIYVCDKCWEKWVQ